MTPSKLSSMLDAPSEAESETTVKPLRLLGQDKRSKSRSRSPSRSRGKTPTKPSTLPRGQLPFRLDTPTPMPPSEFPPPTSLMDSRTKHVRNLEAREATIRRPAFNETPVKEYPEWPAESLVTPVVARRTSLEQNDLPTIKLPRIKPAASAIVQTQAKSRKPVHYISIAMLSLGFIATVFFHGQIWDFACKEIAKLGNIFPANSNPLLLLELDNVKRDLERLRRDLAAIPVAAIQDRIDGLETSENNVHITFADLQKRLSSLSQSVAGNRQESDKALKDLGSQLESIQSQVSSFEKATADLGDLVGTFQKTLPDQDEMVKVAMARLERALPERLLARLNQRGEVVLDPKLYSYLQVHFGKKSEDDGSAAVGMESVENYLNGKLDALEHRILTKEQVKAILEGQLKTALAQIPRSEGHVDVDLIAQQVLERAGQPEHVPNYAADTAGARPIIHLSSGTFSLRSGWRKYLSFADTSLRPHRVALSSDNSFGNCWAFEGQSGRLAVQLAAPLVPTAFGLCHLGRAFQVDRSSAPAELELYAIPDLRDPDDVILIGSGTYRLDGEDCQKWPVQFVLSQPCRHYQLRVLSNHGRQNFTCLYQFALY